MGKSIFTEMVNMAENKSSVWKNGCGFFQEGETTFLGYERVYSNMKNPDAFAELIKKHIKINQTTNVNFIQSGKASTMVESRR